MKKLLGILAAASVLAAGGIYAVDKYQDYRHPESQEVTVETTNQQEAQKQKQKEEESKYAQEEDERDLKPVEYTDASASVKQPFEKKLVAGSAILVDVNSKTILYSKNANTQLAPASTTKMLTALLALRYMDPDQEITVGKEIEKIGEGSSVAYLKEGDVLTVRRIVQGLLMSSGNDAAYVLAVNTARTIMGEDYPIDDSIKLFVDIMNNNVKKMGLKNTNFASPDGYDTENQYSSAHDLAVIAYEALQNNVIMESVSVHSQYVKELGITWKSTDELMNPDGQYYYKNAIGLKTGSTGTAGKCFVGAAKKGEKKVISVVLNSDEPGRWTDSKALLEYGLSQGN